MHRGFKFFFLRVELIYSVPSMSAVQQRDPLICKYPFPFSHSLPSWSIPRDWTEFPGLPSRASWLVHSQGQSLHQGTPNFRSIPLPPSPWATPSLVSMPVSLPQTPPKACYFQVLPWAVEKCLGGWTPSLWSARSRLPGVPCWLSPLSWSESHMLSLWSSSCVQACAAGWWNSRKLGRHGSEVGNSGTSEQGLQQGLGGDNSTLLSWLMRGTVASREQGPHSVCIL